MSIAIIPSWGEGKKKGKKYIRNLGFSASTMRLACERDAKFIG